MAPRDGPEDNLAKLAISAMRNRDAPVLLFVANQLFARRDFKRAEIALQAALAIDPQSTMAREVLAAVYQVTGRLEEARQQSELAYASCWCIVDKLPSLARKPSVLLAMNRGSEHIPSTHLLPLERYDKVRCLLDCAKWDDGTELPAHDVIFNLLGEPDSLVEPDPSFDELLRRMDTGFYVTELMGQGVNGVTGDYSRGASGFWVEHGAIAFPVHEVTIAGNLREMLRTIVAVGSDVDVQGAIRTGSLLIEAMTIAGE